MMEGGRESARREGVAMVVEGGREGGEGWRCIESMLRKPWQVQEVR